MGLYRNVGCIKALYRRWTRLFQRCFDVVSMSGYDFVSTLCNVEKPGYGFCFIFDVLSTSFRHWSTTLKCWLEWGFASKSSWERQLNAFNKFIKMHQIIFLYQLQISIFQAWIRHNCVLQPFRKPQCCFQTKVSMKLETCLNLNPQNIFEVFDNIRTNL